MTVLTVLFIFSLFPQSEKADHWLLIVGGAVWISKSGVDDGIIMTLPESHN